MGYDVTQEPVELAELERRVRVLEERVNRMAIAGLRVTDTGPLFPSGGTSGTSVQAARSDHTHP